MKPICLLDLNYTLVKNQGATGKLRPIERRLAAEEYRLDLLQAVRSDYVILITARPNYYAGQSIENIMKKTGWRPQECYFNDIRAWPPVFKESVLKRFIFPKYGTDGAIYYAVESNPRTRAMYSRYGIFSQPYEIFMLGKQTGQDAATI